MHPKLGYWLVAIPAIASIIVPAAVDLNHTHLFNENWPPHARLHDAMSFLMSMGLGAAALWLLHDPARRRGASLAAAAILSAWSWVSLLLAGLIPGTSYVNAAFDVAALPSLLGVPLVPNIILAIVFIALSAIGSGLLAKSASASGALREAPVPRGR